MSKQDIGELEKNIGYSFNNRNLSLEALTHKSFYHENPAESRSHNERLEFLGDSVLGLVVVEYLFQYDKGYSESTMSKIKSYVVKEAILSDIAIEISLGRFLLLGKGEEDTGGREKSSILANALEAVFGAVYLDGGYESAKRIVLRLLSSKLNETISSAQFFDFKTELQEESQFRFSLLPQYKTVKQEGEEHKKIFTVDVFINGNKFGSGTGRNKKEAETAAAKEALLKIRK